MNKQLVALEFKDYVKRNRVYSCYAPLLVALLGVGILLLSLIMQHTKRINESLDGLAYEYVALGGEQYGENSYYKFDNLSTVFASSKGVNVNTYIQLESDTYDKNMPMCVGTLKKDEIALSRKVADKLRVDVGDTVSVEYGLSERMAIYTVAAIFEYIDNYFEYDKNTDFSVVLLGYDDDLIERKRGSIITFLPEEKRELFLNSGVSYTNFLSLGEEKRTIKIRKVLLDSIIGAAYSILFGIFMAVERRQEKIELRRYYRDGYSVKMIKIFHSWFRRAVVLPVLLVICLFTYFCVDYWHIWLTVNVGIYLIIVGRETSYEKAN